MSSIVQQVEIEAQNAALDVYEVYFRNTLSASEMDLTKKTLFNHLCKKENFIIPDSIFSWIAKHGEDVSVDSICLLLKRKKILDNYVDGVIKICTNKKIDKLSWSKLDELLMEHNIERNTAHKLYIFKLLANCKLENHYYLEWPVENIATRYKNLAAIVDEFVCEAAYLANSNVLRAFTAALILKNITYEFALDSVPKHANILKWLRENISKGRNNPEAHLGWTCGPDSARWPSTVLQDYEETEALLMSIIICRERQ
jgi:hypothetical protein